MANSGKPKLLFLDDRTKRIHAALEQFSDKFEVVIVTNVKECLRALAQDDFAWVHLDHDLRGVDFEDPDSPECGMEVVRYLVKTGWPERKNHPIFLVHSRNLFAGHLMVRTLVTAGFHAYYQPFIYAEKENMKYDKDGNPLQ